MRPRTYYGSGDLEECRSLASSRDCLRSTEGEVEDEGGIGIEVTGTVALGIEATCVPVLRCCCLVEQFWRLVRFDTRACRCWKNSSQLP
jgi:hypothetical protein